MARGIALTIGLNSVDPKHYQGWSGELAACEADANDMAEIAKSCRFTITKLLTKNATRKAVTKALASASSSLKPGDIFMVSYSGHGGQLPDLNSEEDDGEDETWCLFDAQLVDDEIYDALAAFAKGVRILVFSDSCHSGTVIKAAYYASTATAPASAMAAHGLGGVAAEPRFRVMPAPVALRTYQANTALYDPILRNQKIRDAQAKVKASAVLISGCQDNQLSADGTFNGLFTGTLKRVWNGGKFKGSHRAFHKKILTQMPPDQSPNYFRVGAPNPQFESQTPFKV